MSKKSYLISAIILLIAYGVGLALFLMGIMSNGEKLLFTIIGLLICGLPTAIVVVSVARAVIVGRDALGKLILSFLVGLLLGLAVTPIAIIFFFVKAFTAKPKVVVSEASAPEQDFPDPFVEKGAPESENSESNSEI